MSVKGDPEVASTMVFTAKAKNDENKVSVEFSGNVHPIDMRVEEIIDTGEYMILNRRGVEKLQVANEEAVRNGFNTAINIAFRITKG